MLTFSTILNLIFFFNKSEAGFTKAELSDLFETLDMYKSVTPVTAFDLLTKENQESSRNITTLSNSFDKILGGLTTRFFSKKTSPFNTN